MNQQNCNNVIILSPSFRESSKSGIAQLTKSLLKTFDGSSVYGNSILTQDVGRLHPILKALPYHARLCIAYNLYILSHKLANPRSTFIVTSIEYLPLPFLLSNKDQLFFQDFIQLFYPRNPFVWFLYLYGLLLIISGSFQVQSCSKSSIKFLKPFLSRQRVKIYRHNLRTSNYASCTECGFKRDIDLLWLGTTANHKNLKLLCDAIKILKTRNQSPSCVIKIDNNLKNKQLLYDVIGDLPKSINVITRQIDESSLSSLYYRSKVFVSTSRMEGFCIPVRASALCGAIPLISDIASFREIHYTYSYFHKNTPASLALMITKVLDNISVNPNLSISTRLRALEAQDYDINIHSGSLISFD